MSDYKVNEATIAKKAELVDVYAQKMTEAASIVVADSRGLSVDQDTQLRKQLREAGVEFKVVKNSVLRRAAEKAGLEGLSEAFSGPSAVAFSNEDVVAPAKVLADFAKVSSKEEIQAIASLPSRDGLLSMLLSVLQAPVRNVALAVKAVAEKEESAA